eukprot:2620209-Rhodomonas_salina.6
MQCTLTLKRKLGLLRGIPSLRCPEGDCGGLEGLWLQATDAGARNRRHLHGAAGRGRQAARLWR